MSSHPIQLKWRFLEIILLLVIVSLGAVFVRQVGQRVDHRMEELKTEVIRTLEDRIGRKISYSSVSPSIFGYLGIRDLVIYSRDDPDEVLLRINQVKVRYKFFRFISTRAAVLAVSEIQIANSYFDVNYDRDREILQLLESIRTTTGGSERSLFSFGGSAPQAEAYPQIDLSGTNITLRYTYRDWQVEVSNLFFTIANQQDLYDISVRGSVEARHSRAGSPVPGWISTRLKMTGTLDRFFTWSDLAVQIYNLSTETIELKRQTLQVTYDSQALEVRKIQDRAPLDLRISYDTQSKDLSLEFVSEGFRPADLLQLTGVLQRFNPYLLSSVSSTGSLVLNMEERRLRYSADVRIDTPEEALPFDVSVVSRISGNEQILYLNPFSLRSSRGRVEFNGNVLIGSLLPSGLLRFDDFDPRGGQNLNATLRIDRGPKVVDIRSSTLEIGNTNFETFSLNIVPEGGSVRFAMAATLREQSDTGALEATGTFGWQSGLSLSTEASMSKLPLDTLYTLLVPQPKASARLEQRLRRYSLSTVLGASTDFSDYELSTETFEILDKDESANFLRMQATAQSDGAALNDIRFQWNGYSLRGDVSMQRAEEAMAVSTLVWFQDVPYQLEVEFQPWDSLHFNGSYGLEGYYLFRQTRSAVMDSGKVTELRGNPFYLHSENLPITLKKGTMYASADISGLVQTDGSMYTTDSRLRLRNLPFSTITKNDLELGFKISDNQLSVNRILYADEFSELSGRASGELQRLLPLTASGSVSLENREGEELYGSELRIDGNSIQGRLDFASAPIGRLGIEAVKGNLSGSVDINGFLPDPDLAVALSLNEGRLNLDPLGLDLAVDYSRNIVQISSLSASFLNHRLVDGTGSYDIQTGEVLFGSDYRGEYFEQIVNLQVDLQGKLGGLPWPLTLEGVLDNSFEGSLAAREITVDGEQREGWAIALSADGGLLGFDGGPGGESIHGTVARDGSFTMDLETPLPIQGQASGRIRGGQLDSEFSVTTLDMSIINTMTPRTDVFNFTAGSAQGALRIFGPVNDPDWVGFLDVIDAELTFEPSPEPVKPLNGRLIFDGKSFTLPRTVSYSGGTKIEGEGVFYIDHWVPEGTELIFYVDEYPGVHIAYAFDTIFVDGYATGAIRVRTDENTTKLDGKIQANTCRIALLRKEEEQTVSAVPPAPMYVDMDITTGKSVEFYWPAMNFPIVRTFARQGEVVSLVVNEETGEFFMNGEVEIRGGEIFYFDRSFYLKQGSISFEERLDEFDPWISALAEVRERDLNNEEIKIFLEVDNKLSLFSPRFYSEPSRPDVEILNLIGGTILNRFEDTDFGTAAVMLTSDIIGQFGILTPFERAVRDILNLDMFTVRTQFLQNVLLERIQGENLVENGFNPLDNTTLTLGKYLGTDLFVEALVRFQNVDDLTSESNIRPEGELNLEWMTPFFLIEWTFAPSHPENLFLSDNSIGLSWKYSY